MQAIILAAGRGARLHHLTIDRTKAMLPILGKPIVERVMESLTANGLREFTLVVSPDDDEIQPYFLRVCPADIRITFVQQAQSRGMADALRSAASLIYEDFILSACDNLVASDQITCLLAAWHSPLKPNAVLALLPVSAEQIHSTGIVERNGDWVTRIIEKPSPVEAPSRIASLPLYIFPTSLLDYLPAVLLSSRGEYELQDAIQRFIDHPGRVLGVPIDRRYTLTSAADLLNINLSYLSSHPEEIEIHTDSIGEYTLFHPPVFCENNVKIGAGCSIGPRVYLEKGCQIGRQVRLQDTIVLRRGSVPDGAVISGQVIG